MPDVCCVSLYRCPLVEPKPSYYLRGFVAPLGSITLTGSTYSTVVFWGVSSPSLLGGEKKFQLG